jgi:hypothetical protein
MQESKKLRWYEYVWTCLPLVLVLIGGLIGGLVGGSAAAANIKLFRSQASTLAKYTISGSTSLMAVIIWYAIVVLIRATFASH